MVVGWVVLAVVVSAALVTVYLLWPAPEQELAVVIPGPMDEPPQVVGEVVEDRMEDIVEDGWTTRLVIRWLAVGGGAMAIIGLTIWTLKRDDAGKVKEAATKPRPFSSNTEPNLVWDYLAALTQPVKLQYDREPIVIEYKDMTDDVGRNVVVEGDSMLDVCRRLNEMRIRQGMPILILAPFDSRGLEYSDSVHEGREYVYHCVRLVDFERQPQFYLMRQAWLKKLVDDTAKAIP